MLAWGRRRWGWVWGTGWVWGKKKTHTKTSTTLAQFFSTSLSTVAKFIQLSSEQQLLTIADYEGGIRIPSVISIFNWL